MKQCQRVFDENRGWSIVGMRSGCGNEEVPALGKREKVRPCTNLTMVETKTLSYNTGTM